MGVKYIPADTSSLNPRTYTQIHTPTVVQGGGRMEPLPGVFDKLHYFEISPLVDGLGINKITSLALAPRQSGLKIHVLGSECVDVWWSC